MKVEVLRDGKSKILTIVLGELEQAEQAGLFGEDVKTKSEPHSFASLGFTVTPLTDEARDQYEIPDDSNGNEINGVVVTEVIDGSPAAERGVTPGDVIRRIGQRQVMTVSDLIDGVAEVRKSKKTSFLLLVRRGSRERFVAIPVE